MLVVAMGTMALIIVLSTFNGLEDLTRSLYTAHNPEFKVSPRTGKTFVPDSLSLQKILKNENIQVVTPVIEDNALLRSGDAQTVVKMKGVADNFALQYELEPYLEEGHFGLQAPESKRPQALLGIGVQYKLSVGLHGNPAPLVFWYPQRGGKLSISDPSKNFRRRPIYAGGVLAVEQQFDENYVLVPLSFARKLTGYERAVSYLEIRTAAGSDPVAVQDFLSEVFPQAEFLVQNAEEQQEIVLRAFRIERLFAFLAFSGVIAVASFNIFFSLAMLVIEKRKDLAVLRSFGADRWLLRDIFLWEGALIACVGTALGLVLGFILVILQQEFEFVQLGVETSVVSAYPVALRLPDFFWTAGTVLFITLSAAIVPARNAKRIQAQDWL